MRLGPLQILAMFVLFIVALALGLDELMNSLEPLAIPSGVAVLVGVILFSVIPQMSRERQVQR